MIILFSGPCGGFRMEAKQVLLFRDNVQHHLQGGVPTPGYPLIHTIADAVSLAATTSVSATVLWDEVSHAFERLRHIDHRELAVSVGTLAIVTNVPALPEARGTALVRLTGWRAPMASAGVSTLGDVFHDLVARLRIFTDSGRASLNVQISGEPRRLRAPSASSEKLSPK